ncbi:MAG: hypothetical protein IKF19_05815 [Bacilli bacterium]|nr:hypothetical protein [Bacilli bacterium]
MTRFNITKEELKELKEVGNGTDGRVFKYNNNYLVKIYRTQLKNIIRSDNRFNKCIKIYDKDKLKLNNNSDYISYFINNGDEDIRIRNKDGLKLAAKRQKNIYRSSLPVDIVYVDDIFAGCLLKKINGTDIHKLTGMPTKYKRKIIKSLILDIEELLYNYIYHIDIDNSPYSVSLFMDENGNIRIKKGHSNVLVNKITGKTNIIDLDGKSTIYMERYNYNLEQKCLIGLTRLIIEFLFKIDTDEIKEIDELYFELLKKGLSDNIAYKLSSYRVEAIKELKKELKLF